MNATALRGDLVGRVVNGRFTLLRWLGNSRGVDTYLTEFGDPSQKASIKLVPAENGDAEVRMSAWIAAANLAHPHLMKVFASGRCEVESQPMVYVVTEYGDEVLAEIIPDRALSPDEAREMLGPAVDALAYLHGKGFVHGHLKPSNVMAVGDRLKLTTDGLCLAGAIGKPSIERTIYDAPETIQGRIAPAADIWSLGVTLVEILTQRPPAWYGSSAAEPVVPDNLPEPFATIARECLRNDPARRCTLDQIRTRLDPNAPLPVTKKKVVQEITDRPARTIKPEKPAAHSLPPTPIRPAASAAPSSSVGVAAQPNLRRRVVVSLAAVALLIAAFTIWQTRSHQLPAAPSAAQNQGAPAAAPAESPAPAPAAAQPGPVAQAPAEKPSPAPSAPSQPAPQISSAPAHLSGGHRQGRPRAAGSARRAGQRHAHNFRHRQSCGPRHGE